MRKWWSRTKSWGKLFMDFNTVKTHMGPSDLQRNFKKLFRSILLKHVILSKFFFKSTIK